MKTSLIRLLGIAMMLGWLVPSAGATNLIADFSGAALSGSGSTGPLDPNWHTSYYPNVPSWHYEPAFPVQGLDGRGAGMLIWDQGWESELWTFAPNSQEYHLFSFYWRGDWSSQDRLQVLLGGGGLTNDLNRSPNWWSYTIFAIPPSVGTPVSNILLGWRLSNVSGDLPWFEIDCVRWERARCWSVPQPDGTTKLACLPY